MKRKNIFFVLAAAWLAVGAAAFGQTPLSNLVFTVGTTIQTPAAQSLSYLEIGSEAESLLAGKQFAVYGKNDYATNTGAFTLRGKMFLQTSPAAISTLLNQSVALREDLTSLSNALTVVLRKIPGTASQTLAQNMSTALQLATTDPVLRDTLDFLGRNHPAVLLCNGEAFSETINSVTTYEIREIDSANGNAGDVIGRATVVPGNPVILPAPGFPFQLPAAGMPFRDGANNPAERIKIYLRWGTPPELRRLSLLNFGFNIWRMTKTIAEQNNFHITPPTLTQLYANATMANDAPVMATKEFPANLPGDPADTTTFFFVDDNGRKFGMPLFVDGDQYYYFITARDILGRDGLVSAGALATACRQLAPAAPTGLKVQNILQAVALGGGTTNVPRLQLTWAQNTNTDDAVSEYWIYRWDNPSAAMTNDTTPLNARIGIVTQLAGTNGNVFTDNGTNLPTTPSVTNYWFTIRAVSQAACGPLVSPNSSPAWGVLREREGPAAATGEVLGSCGTPVVMFRNFNTLPNPANTNGQNLSYRLTCQRRDSAIAWVSFSLTSTVVTNTIGPVQFPPDGDTVSLDVSVPNTFGTSLATNQIICTVGDFEDNNSTPTTNYFITSTTTTGMQQEAVLLAGEILVTALNSSDPLLAALNGNVGCSETIAVTPYPDGTVSMKMAVGGNLNVPRMIQVFSNSVWTDVGAAWPDTNHVYWISYPACLIGPLPTFRGCIINVPDTGNCDQHITSAGDVVAPIIVRFRPTPRSREYRLYRRADDGPSTLLSQGNTTFDPLNPGRAIVIPDDVMPPSAAHLCYYVQMFDEHGNGSPLALLGCKYARPATLPRPVLAELQPVGDTNHPQVLLNWFCPVAGVHRFEIKIHRDDQTGSSQSTGFTGIQLSKQFAYFAKKTYAGLLSLQNKRYLIFDEAQFTPPIGPNFGPGPQFTLTADVVAGGTYTITVAAVDEHDKAYTDSEPQTFTWKVVNTNIQTVPWPARPLPSVTHFDDDNGSTNYRVAATILRYNQFNAQTYLDTRYPVGIRIGDLKLLAGNFDLTDLTAGTTNFFSYRPVIFTFNSSYALDVSLFVYKCNSSSPERNNEPLLPIVVYRLELTNATFPKVSGNLVQVTPLIERIPSITRGISDGTTVTVPDLLIGTGFESANSQLPSADNSHLYLRDQQPVMIGASYHYYVVRFNAKHEVAETIDAGIVTIPPN
jgi:hypothetical protein